MPSTLHGDKTQTLQRDCFHHHQLDPQKNSKHFLVPIREIDWRREVQQGIHRSVLVPPRRHKGSGVVLAIKIIKKETIKKENFLEQLIRELKIQSFLSHVNLVKLYSFFHDRLNIYLLLEFCAGGQLYDLFRVKSKLR